LTEEQPSRPRNLSSASLVALTAATLAGPALLVTQVFVGGQAKDAGIIAAVSIILFGLVMTRMGGLARSQAILARRERGLREFGDRLVAAKERDEVLTFALTAVRAMVGRCARVCLLSATNDAGDRVAISEPPGLEGLVVIVNVEPGSPTATVRPVGSLPPGTLWGEQWSAISIVDPSAEIDRMLISHDGPLPPDVAANLEAVAGQMTIAIQRVELAAGMHKRRAEARFRSLVENASDESSSTTASSRRWAASSARERRSPPFSWMSTTSRSSTRRKATRGVTNFCFRWPHESGSVYAMRTPPPDSGATSTPFASNSPGPMQQILSPWPSGSSTPSTPRSSWMGSKSPRR